MDQPRQRRWRHAPRSVTVMLTLGLVVCAVALAVVAGGGLLSGWEFWSVLLTVAMTFNVVMMALLLWSFHARYTEADGHRLRHHEPVARSKSFDLPWSRVADLRMRGGVLNQMAWVVADDGTEYPLASLPPREFAELQEWWLTHRGDGRPADTLPPSAT
ncbi:hypothetical protein [uncultured Serinicoccus sp.]|uniref:hypothetical protein n=1 Tax=uncultured Serinicoccus sp. TaxID=735514 RepID=UPI00260ECB84|nr:hypothetical protein [uncultured Serinicoccus sp.]